MKEHNDIRYKHHCAPANLIRHLDSSMKTGLGLKEIHESFGIAFLNVLVRTFFLACYKSVCLLSRVYNGTSILTWGLLFN